MIINVRGTNGSGKSTLVRKVMDSGVFGTRVGIQFSDWSRPIGYVLPRLHGPNLYVVGQYETPAGGGCDSIPCSEIIIDSIVGAHAKGMHVLFEGLVFAGDFKWSRRLHEMGYPYRVIHIDRTLADCMDSVNERRRARGELEPCPEDNVLSKMKAVNSTVRRFREIGVPVSGFEDRDAAYCHVLELLESDVHG